MKKRDLGTQIFTILIALAAFWIVLVPFASKVREIHMRRFHASSGSYLAWAVLQVVPSMYNFYNERWLSLQDQSLDAFFETERPGRAVNHYPLSGLTYPFAPDETLGTDGIVLRSRYRGATLITRYRASSRRIPEGDWFSPKTVSRRTMSIANNLRDWSGGKRSLAWLIVYAGWMSAFYIKLFPPKFPLILLDQVARPISCDFFPGFFVSGKVALAAFALPAATLLALVFAPRRLRLASSWILLISTTVLLIHIKGFNDATYATLWWSALWMIWWSPRLFRDDPRDILLAERFAKAVVSLCFLGGTIGKLTPEDWNGEVLERIYFLGKSGFPFESLRETSSPEQLRSIATMFSRVAIVTEGLLATAIFWPTRLAAFVAVFTMIGMLIVSKIQLYSVLGVLIALMVAVLYLHEGKSGTPRRDGDFF